MEDFRIGRAHNFKTRSHQKIFFWLPEAKFYLVRKKNILMLWRGDAKKKFWLVQNVLQTKKNLRIMSFLSKTIPTFSRTSGKHFFPREIQFSLTQWGLATFGIGLRGNHWLGMGLRIQMTSSLPWKSTTKALLTRCLVKKLGTLQKTRSMWQWHSELLPCVHCFFFGKWFI